MTDNLEIVAVKVLKDKVTLEYVDKTNQRPYSTEDKSTPHPDLVNSLKPLNQYLARIHYLSEEHLDKISVNGFSTKAESSIYVIKGMLTTPSGKKVAINSDAIDSTKEVYGFEEHMEEIIDNIRSEAYEFFFNDKTSQQTIPFEEDGGAIGPAEPGEPGEPVSQEQKNDDIGEGLEEENDTMKAAMDGKALASGKNIPEQNEKPEVAPESNQEPPIDLGAPPPADEGVPAL